MKYSPCLILILTLVMGQWCIAASEDSLSTRYRHGLNTDTWFAMLNFQARPTSRAYVNLQETANAFRLKVAPNQNKWKEQNALSVQSIYSLRPNFSLQILGSHYIFRDKQSGFENDIRTQMMGAGFTYMHPKFSLPLTIGLKQDTRVQQSDFGVSYNMSLKIPRIQLQEYTHQLRGRLDGDDLDRRTNHSQSIQYQVSKQFYQDTADTLNIEYRDLRRDYYISPAGEMESREDNTQSATNRLTYHIGSRTHMHFSGRITMHRLKISLLTGSAPGLKRERKDFEIFGSMRLKWQRDWMNGDFILKHHSEDQKYQLAEALPSSPYSGSSLLRTPDNQSSITSYILRTQFPVNFSDTLSFNTHFQKLQYDTPDEENFDDRDELRWHFDLIHQHRFSPTLTLNTQLSTHLLHLVYIFGEKSADNNWTRIFRLEPELTWQPSSQTRWKQSAAVLANYVDYDFDSELAGIRSFLYRKYQLEDSISVGLSARTTALINYRLELDENGKLIWNNWLQQKLSDRQSHSLSFQMDYSPWFGLHLRPGYSFFIRRGYRYTSLPDGSQEKKASMDFQSHGPILKWAYHGKQLRLNFSAQTIRTKTLTVKRQIYTRLDFEMRWIF